MRTQGPFLGVLALALIPPSLLLAFRLTEGSKTGGKEWTMTTSEGLSVAVHYPSGDHPLRGTGRA